MAQRRSDLKLPADYANLSYIAGIIDGEGSICISHQRQGKYDSLTVQVNVANTQPLLVYWLQQYFGCGFICKRQGARVNCRTVYWWIVRSQKAVKAVLEKVYPYLFLKRRQAKLCLILQTIRETIKVPEREGKLWQFQRQPVALAEIKEKIHIKMLEANSYVEGS